MDTVLNQLLITYHYTHRSILSPHWRSFFLKYIVINRDSQSVNVQGVNDCGVFGPKRDIYFAIPGAQCVLLRYSWVWDIPLECG